MFSESEEVRELDPAKIECVWHTMKEISLS